MTHSSLPNFSRLVSGGAEEAGMKGCANARRGWMRELFHFFPVRQSVIDWPKRFLKRLERWAAVLNPHSRAIAATVALVARRRRHTSFRRHSDMKSAMVRFSTC